MTLSNRTNLADYQAQVGRIPYGKRLPTALYFHRDELAIAQTRPGGTPGNSPTFQRWDG